MTVNLIYGLSFGSDDADFVRVAYSTWSTFCVCVCGKKYEAAAVHNAPFHTHIDGIVAQSSR